MALSIPEMGWLLLTVCWTFLQDIEFRTWAVLLFVFQGESTGLIYCASWSINSHHKGVIAPELVILCSGMLPDTSLIAMIFMLGNDRKIELGAWFLRDDKPEWCRESQKPCKDDESESSKAWRCSSVAVCMDIYNIYEHIHNIYIYKTHMWMYMHTYIYINNKKTMNFRESNRE